MSTSEALFLVVVLGAALGFGSKALYLLCKSGP